MDRRGEGDRASDRPVEGPLQAPATPRRVAGEAGHGGGREALGPGRAEQGHERRVEAGVELPSVRVGGEAPDQRAAGRQVGQVEEHRHRDRRGPRGHPPAGSRWNPGGRGELDRDPQTEQRAGQGGSPPAPWPGRDDEESSQHREDSQRLHMAAPRHLEKDERRQEVEQWGERGSARPGRRQPVEQPADAEVCQDPCRLEEEHGRTDRRQGPEDELGARRIDGRHGRVVDQRVPARSQRGEDGVGGRVEIGVYAVDLDPAVPQVAVDVVGEPRRQRKQGESRKDRQRPQFPSADRPARMPCRGEDVRAERCCPQDRGRPGRSSSARHPAEGYDEENAGGPGQKSSTTHQRVVHVDS